MKAQQPSVPANCNPKHLIKPCDVDCFHVKFFTGGFTPATGTPHSNVQIFTVADWQNMISNPAWKANAGVKTFSIIHDPLKK